MGSHLRQLVFVRLLAGVPGLAVAADDWQAQVGAALDKCSGRTHEGGWSRRSAGCGAHLLVW
jgi:hypothetical protein